jgi:hypothetical protein
MKGIQNSLQQNLGNRFCTWLPMIRIMTVAQSRACGFARVCRDVLAGKTHWAGHGTLPRLVASVMPTQYTASAQVQWCPTWRRLLVVAG